MHLPDGFLNDKTNAAMFGAAAVGLAHALEKARASIVEKVPVFKLKLATYPQTGSPEISARSRVSETGKEKIWRMAAVGSFIFAAQMINFSITGGVSGHLLGGVLAALIVGPWEALIVMSVILATQAFVFGDGGIVALAANIVNIGIVGTLGGYYFYVLTSGLLKNAKNRYTFSVAFAAWLSVVLASIAVSVEIAISGTGSLSSILPEMLQYHIFIGIGEALITVVALSYLGKNGFQLYIED
jgi:cobalt/nickel transport system permease protein